MRGILRALVRLRPKPPRSATPPIMNKLTLKGDWNVAKGKLRQKYAQLTDDDLVYEKGREDELLGRVQKRVGQTREEVERVVGEIFKS